MADRGVISPLLGRKRQRRGADTHRRFADEIEKSRAVQPLGPRAASRRPTRIIPDAAGFDALSKTDIKRDIRDIGKHPSCSVFVYDSGSDENEEEEEETGLIFKSSRPPYTVESTLSRKKRRYASWVFHPNAMQTDLTTYRTTVAMVKNELSKIQNEEEIWIEAFDATRRHFISAISSLHEDIREARNISKTLYELNIEECGLNRKRRTMNMTDIENELSERQEQLEASIAEYERVVEEAATGIKEHGHGHGQETEDNHMLQVLPITVITVDALDCPEDRPLHCRHRTSTATSANQSVAKGHSSTSGGDVSMDIVVPSPSPSSTTTSNLAHTAVKTEVVVKTERNVTTTANEHEDRDDNKFQFSTIDSHSSGDGKSTSSSSTLMHMNSRSRNKAKDKTKNNSTNSNIHGNGNGNGNDMMEDMSVTTEGNTNNHNNNKSSLLSSLFSEMERTVRFSEAAVTDLNDFFPEENDNGEILPDISSLLEILRGTEADRSSSASTGTSRSDKERQLVDELLHCESESQWVRLLNDKNNISCTSGSSSLSSFRKKRKSGIQSNSFIPVRSSALTMVPRGLPLLISPASTFPERVVGAIYGKESSDPSLHEYKLQQRRAFLPTSLIMLEEAQLRHWDVQSQVLRVTNRLRRISQSTEEWERRVIESAAVLQKTETACASVHYEDATETKRCRRDLLLHGVIASNGAEIPMSPMAVNHGAMHMGGGAANRGGRGLRGKRGGGRSTTRQILQPSVPQTLAPVDIPESYDTTTLSLSQTSDTQSVGNPQTQTQTQSLGGGDVYTAAVSRSPSSSNEFDGSDPSGMQQYGTDQSSNAGGQRRRRGGSVKRKTSRKPY